MPSPACRSALLPLSASVSVRLPGVIVTVGLPAPWAHLMLRAEMVSFPADTFSRGRRSPNTFEPEHASEVPALRALARHRPAGQRRDVVATGDDQVANL